MSGYTNAHRAEFKQQTEVVEVAVEEGIFVVPFEFQGYTVLEAIHLVRRRVNTAVVDHDGGGKLLLYPAPNVESSVKAVCKFRPV